MTSFLKGFLLIIMVFCFCGGISLIVRLILVYFRDKKTNANKPQQSPTVIYVTNTQTKPKKKRRKKKSPDVALKGILITPEKFQTIKNGNFERHINKVRRVKRKELPAR